MTSPFDIRESCEIDNGCDHKWVLDVDPFGSFLKCTECRECLPTGFLNSPLINNKKLSDNVWPEGICLSCHWPVLMALNNSNFCDKMPKEDQCFDRYVYCTNKGCDNHEGESQHQSDIDWIIYPEKRGTK